MKPSTHIVKREKLRVVSKNYAATTKSALFTHNWTPVTKQALKIAPAWAMTM
jgi:hypothetical protein